MLGRQFDGIFQQEMLAEYRGHLMSVKMFIAVALLLLSLVVILNRFSGQEKKGRAWILAVIVAAGCLWYIGK